MALDNFRTQKIIWDRANRKIFEAIEANAGDSNGRKLVVQVINQETTEVLSGTTLSLGWKSRNGAKGLDAFNVVDASKGIFEIYYTTEMLSNIGNIEASLILIDSTGRIESSTFTISVRPSTVDDASVQSKNSFTALTAALVRVNDFDTRLAQKADKSYVDSELNSKPEIDDATESTSKLWSSSRIKEVISSIPKGDKGESGTASVAIDDTKTNTTQTWTSSKINARTAEASVAFRGNTVMFEEYPSLNEIYVKFDNVVWNGGGTAWAMIKNQIADSSVFVTSPNGVTNCLKLTLNQALVYDTADNIVKITSNVTNSQFSIVRNVYGYLIGNLGSYATNKVIPDVMRLADKVNTVIRAGSTFNLIIEQVDEGVYFKFNGSLQGLGANKNWANVKSDLDNASLFVSSPSGVSDCLFLSEGWLAFDVITEKFKINTSVGGGSSNSNEILIAFVDNQKLIDGFFANWFFSEYANKPSGSSLPSSVTDRLLTANEKVADLQDVDTLSFLFMTDAHYSMSNDTRKASMEHFKAVSDFTRFGTVDLVVLGGDNVDGNYPKETVKQDWSKVFKEMTFDTPVASLVGNHDMDTTDSPTTQKEWYTRLIKPIENEVFVDSDNPTGGYFYRDFEERKIRVVCLNTSDLPSYQSDGVTPYDVVNTTGIRGAQLSWLANIALDLADKADKNSWSVVVISHVPPLSELQLIGRGTPNNGTVAKEIVKAFMDGTTYSASSTSGDFSYDVNVDYTEQGQMNVVGWFYGHVHHDRITAVDGINFIATLNSRGDKISDSSLPPGATAPARTLGTDTEDAWDVVTINTPLRKANIVRYGAGSDREFTF